jgi:ribosome-associated protein
MSKSTVKRAATPPRLALPDDLAVAVRAAADKKANEMVVLDLRKAAGFTDYFLICTAHNPRQIRAIADAVQEGLTKTHVKPAHVEGYERSEWVLLDYFDFVVHIFSKEMRTFYGLERLWGSASTIDLRAVLPTEPPHR